MTAPLGPAMSVALVALLVFSVPDSLTAHATAPSSSSTSAAAPAWIVAGSASQASPVSPKFWGLDIVATSPFTLSDGANIAATPVTYLRFPGGDPGEEYNDSSNQIFSPTGGVTTAATSISQFISVCQAIHCHSILQLPAEINSSSTAAFLANYIVHKLGYHPDYWEIGNAPGSWTHYNVPWSKWGTTGGGNTNPLQFAQLVHRYISAIRAVDPTTPIVALGIAVISVYDKPWVPSLMQLNGPNLFAVSLHSYAGREGPPVPTLALFFASLESNYSLPNVLSRERAEILSGCSTCTKTQLFIDEINAAYARATFATYVGSFNGTLFIAAEVTQGLNNHADNLDWFNYVGGYPGGWESSPGHLQSQYYLFKDLLSQLASNTLPTTVTGPPGLYAAVTTDGSQNGVLVVNTNLTTPVALNLIGAGFSPTATLTERYWPTGQALPSQLTLPVKASAVIAPLSAAVFTGPAASGIARYPVTFSEAGLPPGTQWSVTLNGYMQSSTGTSISFTQSNGTYSYTVGSVSGYTSSPSSGTVTVNGASENPAITFAAVTTPTIKVSPTRGPVGSTVTVSGTGFSVSTALKSLVFDSKTITSCTSGSLKTGGTGAFGCTFKVPSGTSGTTVKATDVSGKKATGTFTVTKPEIKVSPTRGPMGSTVSVSGTGFSVATAKSLPGRAIFVPLLSEPRVTSRGGFQI